jgi:hypothetical protein
MAKLVTHVPGYNKGRKDIYRLLAPRIPEAIRNAERLQRENTRTRPRWPPKMPHSCPVSKSLTQATCPSMADALR